MISDSLGSGRSWERVEATTGADFGSRHARRIIVETTGDVYLIRNPGDTEALFMVGAPAGMQIDQHCSGIGSASTADLIAQF